MAKTRELSSIERLAIIHLLKAGISYQKIGSQVCCHNSIACRVYQKFMFSKKIEQGKLTKNVVLSRSDN